MWTHPHCLLYFSLYSPDSVVLQWSSFHSTGACPSLCLMDSAASPMLPGLEILSPTLWKTSCLGSGSRKNCFAFLLLKGSLVLGSLLCQSRSLAFLGASWADRLLPSNPYGGFRVTVLKDFILYWQLLEVISILSIASTARLFHNLKFFQSAWCCVNLALFSQNACLPFFHF